ncbi:MAG: transglutaminase-like cysteine peptidase, partial [Bradyrhizobium sp.]
TDKGEFILDNLTEKVVLWNRTDYHFVKRQSQSDQKIWVALGNGHPAVATASAEDH